MFLTKEQQTRIQEEIDKTEEEISQIQNKDKEKIVSPMGIILLPQEGPWIIENMETVNLILGKQTYLKGLRDLLDGVEVLAVYKHFLQTEITSLERQMKIYLNQLKQLETEKAGVLSLLK